MDDKELCLKPINDLLKERFFIPAYQRGYRWTSRQVTELLDDISAFHLDAGQNGRGKFYCLQPIVVMKRSEGDWELVDGQQRLTTIFLVLSFLKPMMEMLGKERFRIHYKTRSGSEEFLQNLDESKRNDNIDYHHICSAYDTIKKWFESRDGNQRFQFLQCLTNPDDMGPNVRVIWYELPARENPVDVFLRLNMGKIPLTDAELIRALFLRSRNFIGDSKQTQLQIGQEWDSIEKCLQSDDFWYFINGTDKSYSVRIEYIFWLMTRDSPPADLLPETPYYTFLAYNRKFAEAVFDPALEWLRVKQGFMTCEEWFRDRTLYHLVGFLVADGVPLVDLWQMARDKTKRGFRDALRIKIRDRLFPGACSPASTSEEHAGQFRAILSELSYDTEKDKRRIRSVLLLFNIATLLANTASNTRFPFDSYRKEQWDLEHVRALKSDRPDRIDGQKRWLQNVLDYWTGPQGVVPDTDTGSERHLLCAEVRAILDSASYDRGRFEAAYERLLAHFQESDFQADENCLGNLVLLDATTNRSYKNSVFPIKRKRLVDLTRSGTFVPICTTNVFLKFYSDRIDNMLFWSEVDHNSYFDSIVNTLSDFFNMESGGEQ